MHIQKIVFKKSQEHLLFPENFVCVKGIDIAKIEPCSLYLFDSKFSWIALKRFKHPDFTSMAMSSIAFGIFEMLKTQFLIEFYSLPKRLSSF